MYDGTIIISAKKRRAPPSALVGPKMTANSESIRSGTAIFTAAPAMNSRKWKIMTKAVAALYVVREICRSGSPTLEKYMANLESWMRTPGAPAAVEIMWSRVSVYATVKRAVKDAC